MSAHLSPVEAAGEALLMCECGHDIGGEHNSSGCYHIEWGKDGDDRACDCKRDDDRDLVLMAGQRHLALVAAAVAAEREAWAGKIEALADAWADDTGVEGYINLGEAEDRLRALIAEARS